MTWARLSVRPVLLLAISLVIARQAPAVARTVTDGIFSVEDGTGRRLGLITLPRTSTSTPGASRTVFESPDGRVLVAIRQRDAKLEWTSYRDVGSGEQLILWSRRDFAKSGRRVPTIFAFGEEVFGWSLEKEVDAAEVSRRDENLRSWLSSRSPAFAGLIARAVEASIVAQKGKVEAPKADEYFRIALPMIPLFSAYGSSQKGRPDGVLRLLESGLKEAERLRSKTANVAPPAFSGPDVSRAWAGALMGGREEPLGRLSLGWQGVGKPGQMQGRIVTLDWSQGKRAERAVLILLGPAGAYFGRIERRMGDDWSTVVSFDGFGEVKSEGWWVPFLVGDRFGKDGKQDGVEIPPVGERERQRARSALLDVFLAAMGRSGLSEPVAAETLYRWQRIFNLPEVKESLPSIVPLADVLSDAPIPVFQNEVDEPWAGTADLRDVVTR